MQKLILTCATDHVLINPHLLLFSEVKFQQVSGWARFWVSFHPCGHDYPCQLPPLRLLSAKYFVHTVIQLFPFCSPYVCWKWAQVRCWETPSNQYVKFPRTAWREGLVLRLDAPPHCSQWGIWLPARQDTSGTQPCVFLCRCSAAPIPFAQMVPPRECRSEPTASSVQCPPQPTD